MRLIYTAVMVLFIFAFVSSLMINIDTNDNNNLKIENTSTFKLDSAPLSLILINNLKVIFLMLAGSITFGLSTFINLIFNGFSFGMLISNAYNSGMPIKLILALTIPHGIFEIPAMLISAVAGFKIPYEVIQYLRDKKEKPLTEEDIKEFLKLAVISIILIIIAAFVEVYITPKIANYLLH